MEQSDLKNVLKEEKKAVIKEDITIKKHKYKIHIFIHRIPGHTCCVPYFVIRSFRTCYLFVVFVCIGVVYKVHSIHRKIRDLRLCDCYCIEFYFFSAYSNKMPNINFVTTAQLFHFV